MAWTLEIGGVDKTSYLRAGTLEVTLGINGRASLRCVLKDPLSSGAYRPDPFTGIVLKDSGTAVFGGTILTVDDSPMLDPDEGTFYSLEAADYHEMPSRRLVSKTFASGQTLKQVLTTLTTDYLAGYGISVNVTQANGATLGAIAFEDVTCEEALNTLYDLTGWIWIISPLKVIRFESPGTQVLGSGVGSNAKQIRWTKNGDEYANALKVYAGTDKQEARTDDLSSLCNGSNRLFALVYKAASPPNLITINGTPLPVGLYGSDDWIWTFDVTNNRYVHKNTEPALTGGTTVSSTYTAQFPSPFWVEDATEIAAKGRVEKRVDAPDVWDKAGAEAVGTTELNRRKAMPRELKLLTRTSGWVAGAVISLTYSGRNVSGWWFVRSYTIRDDGFDLMYDVDLVEGQGYVPDWRQFWRDMGASSSGTTTITGSGTSGSGGVTSVGLSAFAGGSRARGVSHSTWVDVPEFVPVMLDSDKFSGTTLYLRVECKTSNAATSVRPRLAYWNGSAWVDATTTSTTTTSTAWEEQLVPITLASGRKSYRLQVLPGNTSNPVYAIGIIE